MSLVGLCGRRKFTVVNYAVVLLCFSLLALVFRLPVVEFVGNEMKNIRRKLLKVLGNRIVDEKQGSSALIITRSLNEVMIVDRVMDKSVDEITQMWKLFHDSKDCVSAVIPANVYIELQAKASMCPLFLYPLPRKEGFEFFYSQFSNHRFNFTTLASYQLHHENSPICLTLTHYTDFQESKGIVLMKGELDLTVITPVDAQFLANQVQLYYNNHFALVKQLNHHPSHFDYNILLQHLGQDQKKQ